MAVVILAGGEGRRISGGKPLRLLGTQTLLERSLALAAGWSDAIAISVRDARQVGDFSKVPLLIDEGADGPIAGIASALAFAADRRLEAVLTIPCDNPLLPDDLLNRLASALGSGIGVAVPASGGRLHPGCSLWRAEVQSLLPAYLGAGRSSLTGFATQARHVEVDWPVTPHDPFFNVNSADDLAVASALVRSR